MRVEPRILAAVGIIRPVTDDVRRLRLERDLYLRLLELGARDDLPEFLEDALGLLVEATGARKGTLDIERGRFFVARGFEEAELPDVRSEISSGIVAEVLATGRTISTASAVEDPRFAGQPSVQAGRIRAVLCAPVGEPALGVVYLQERNAPGPFPEEARALAEILARHLAPLTDRLLAREDAARGRDHTEDLRVRLAVDDLAGTSSALAGVLRQIAVAAPVPIAVLVTGETGTGKTAVARALHRSSPRAAAPFVEINCAAIPEALFESEVFGAEKGAHSTATRRMPGKIDAAKGGTLFLDEVGEMPLGVQAKLLTFLQDKRYSRLGSNEPLDADVRIVAATNADLAERVREKRFREDLYWRLVVLPIHVPALRDRPEDVGPIAESLVRRISASSGRPIALSRAARVALGGAEWPGNVRQLENALSRAWATALAAGSTTIEPRHLFPEQPPEQATSSTASPETYSEALRRFQAKALSDALEACGWNVSEAARRLDLSRSHLNDLIKAHGLARKR